MTDYSKMSDFHINRKVAEKLGGFLARDILEKEQTIFKWHKGNKYSEFDPCNSWADAGPIAQKGRIGISPCGDIWHAYSTEEDFVSSLENPCRAICIVFLMMNEGE